MKLISLLATLLIIAFLVMNQFGSSSSSSDYQERISQDNRNTPKVPTDPKDLPKFDKEINEFVLDSADRRKKELEDSSSN